jgi:hypothetical protein
MRIALFLTISGRPVVVILPRIRRRLEATVMHEHVKHTNEHSQQGDYLEKEIFGQKREPNKTSDSSDSTACKKCKR